LLLKKDDSGPFYWLRFATLWPTFVGELLREEVFATEQMTSEVDDEIQMLMKIISHK